MERSPSPPVKGAQPQVYQLLQKTYIAKDLILLKHQVFSRIRSFVISGFSNYVSCSRALLLFVIFIPFYFSFTTLFYNISHTCVSADFLFKRVSVCIFVLDMCFQVIRNHFRFFANVDFWYLSVTCNIKQNDVCTPACSSQAEDLSILL